ncbi:E3 ubiquitin-protein ligase NRDP1-like [Pipistrellus kuhlii]|uniref:E3 ubiquitin-protein ligase NRDP1-like n=1 Tax=Pipistrellus kuhlii TaxID=59472 RepID=UPI00174F7A68|nr:E3 ubiquitin-protein ligase NRDP1-like [Pipistrellus kuhlii]
MGYDVTRFQGDVDEDLLCPICGGVLEEPVQAPRCEHAFCGACIAQWFSQQQTCPVDRSAVTVAHLGPVPRIMQNMLSKLRIACDHAAFGCSAVVRLDGLTSHLSDCEHNPRRRQGQQGDGLAGPREELPARHCLPHLRALVQQQQARLAELERASADHALQLAEQKRAIQQLKAHLAPDLQGGPGEPRGEAGEEVLRWVSSLQPARVTRWGGMISTPDAGLQAAIERSLLDSGCPAPLVGELIQNAHERSWPQGLATLETRQTNRRCYKNYVAKRIPGRQAVVVMACENRHMGEGMVREPGLIMIFSQGVEEM